MNNFENSVNVDCEKKQIKILMIASIGLHFVTFHMPFIKELQNHGYEIHIAAEMGESRKELENNRIVCHDFKFKRSPFELSNIKVLFSLISLMRTTKFSLVHVHTPVAALMGRISALVTGTKPVVYTAHGFHFYKGAPFMNWVIYYTIEKAAARWTDYLITINEEDFRSAEKLNLRNKSGRYLVHGVGVNVDKYFLNDEELRKEYRSVMGVKDGSIVITCLAEFNLNKNQILLIKAVQVLLKKGFSIYLLLVGGGNNYLNLKGYIEENNLIDCTYICEFREDIPQILNMSDILALLSLREGLPRSIMEGMAAGIPIIATNIRGSKELVHHGENGYLVETNDLDKTIEYLEILISDSILRKNMGKRGRELIKKYSAENVVNDLCKIYDTALKN